MRFRLISLKGLGAKKKQQQLAARLGAMQVVYSCRCISGPTAIWGFVSRGSSKTISLAVSPHNFSTPKNAAGRQGRWTRTRASIVRRSRHANMEASSQASFEAFSAKYFFCLCGNHMKPKSVEKPLAMRRMLLLQDLRLACFLQGNLFAKLRSL